MLFVDTIEKRFESDIEAFFLSPEGGYTKGTAPYSPDLGLFDSVLTDFVKETQPKAWARFCLQNVETVRNCSLTYQSQFQ